MIDNDDYRVYGICVYNIRIGTNAAAGPKRPLARPPTLHHTPQLYTRIL